MITIPKYAGIPEAEVRTRSDRDAVDAGMIWNPEEGERLIRFVEKYLRPTRGNKANEKVSLIPWQREAYMRWASWRQPNGERRFTKGMLGLCRQQGKSLWAAGLGLWMAIGEGKWGSTVWLSAANKEQASGVVFQEILHSVESSKKLSACCVTQPSMVKITYPAKHALIKGIANKGGFSKLGSPPYLYVADEYAVWPSYDLMTAVESGHHASCGGFLLMTTNSGRDRTTPAYATWTYAEAVQDGSVSDPSFFPLVFSTKPDDDIHDPATWKKAAPSLGYTFPESAYQTLSNEAKRSKIKELEFRQFGLSQWVSSTNQFLNLDAWQSCSVSNYPDLKGKDAYLGVDLSTTTDLTSVGVIIPFDGKYYFDHYNFCCRQGAEKRNAQNMGKYALFEQEGHLKIHDGNSVDFEDVRSRIRQLCDEYRVRSIMFDPSHNANDTMIILQNEGQPVAAFGRGGRYFNQPMRRLYELVMDGRFSHKGDSLLNWEAANLESKKDSFDMLQPTKPADEAKIDTMIALLMALSGALKGQAEDGGENANAGVLWL